MNYYLAIDIGASSGRHIVGWLEEGEIKTEEVKDLPFSAVWKEYLKRENLTEDYLTEIKRYEKEELSKR